MYDIKKSLTENAKLIEGVLEKYLDRTDEQIGIIFDAMRYSALDGGKRIRPYLAIEFCRMYGGKDEAVLPFAAALEMIHCYSLIHDDLPCMDNDDYRRGKPTSHKKFGEANALLAGDALLTYAFEVAGKNRFVSDKTAREAVIILAKNAGADGMIGGQVLDLIGENQKYDYDTLIRMNTLKTGRLIKTACLLGALAAGQQDTLCVEKYAYNLGLAFQITDDLLDAGTEDNKTTFLSFMSKDEAYALAKKLLDEAKTFVSSESLSCFCDYILDRKM